MECILGVQPTGQVWHGQVNCSTEFVKPPITTREVGDGPEGTQAALPTQLCGSFVGLPHTTFPPYSKHSCGRHDDALPQRQTGRALLLPEEATVVTGAPKKTRLGWLGHSTTTTTHVCTPLHTHTHTHTYWMAVWAGQK